MTNSKFKLIILASLIIFIGITAAIGFSRALFEDKQTLHTNVSMGTLELSVEGIDQATIPLDFENLVPGQLEKVPFQVNNVGSIEGNFWVEGKIISSAAGSNPEEEAPLIDCARLSLVVDIGDLSLHNIINNNLLYNIEDQFDLETDTVVDQVVNDGPADMEIWINTHNCGEEVMGDTVAMTLDLYLTQVVESD